MTEINIERQIDLEILKLEESYTATDEKALELESLLKAVIGRGNDCGYHQGVFGAYTILIKCYIINQRHYEALAYLKKQEIMIEYKLVVEANYIDLAINYIIYYIDINRDSIEIIKYYHLGLKYANHNHNQHKLLIIQINYGIYLVESEQYMEAIALYKRLESTDDGVLEAKHRMYIYDNLGVAYYFAHQYSLALNYLAKAYDLSIKHNERRIRLDAAETISKIYVKQGSIAEAKAIIKDSMDKLRFDASKQDIVKSLIMLCKIYSDQGLYEEAYKELLVLEDQLDGISSKYSHFEYYQLKAKVCEKLKKFQEAYDAEINYHKYDLILAKENKAIVERNQS